MSRSTGITQQKFVRKEPIEISEQVYFRDMPLVNITFYPIIYDPHARNLKIIKSATLTLKIAGGVKQGKAYVAQSKIDYLYKDMVINFEQARNWLVGHVKGLRKISASFSGPWCLPLPVPSSSALFSHSGQCRGCSFLTLPVILYGPTWWTSLISSYSFSCFLSWA